MATITGPKIQMPSVNTPLVSENGQITLDWAAYFHSLNDTLFALSRSGPTGSRPDTGTPGRYIGEPYFDNTIGKPVFLKTASSSAWVDATGAPA